MASSSNSEHHRGEQRPARLVRQNSSFIGTIKNIVKLPLNWFANQDDADTTSTPTKRRRQPDHEPTEHFTQERDDFAMQDDHRAVDSDEESSRRTKRMRVHSPPHRTSQPYLDPPTAALRHADPSRKPSIVPRASSAVLPSSRATLSPRRHFPLTRTMSIDPPHHPLVRRESTAFNFGPPPSSAESDYDMAIDTFRDISMPPSPSRSPRPSFRMRSSVTPQPQYQPPTRYISEPPPLNTLVSNPVFLHAPVQPAQPSVAPTLGALVESVRAKTKSPTRQQHSSLFLGSSAIAVNIENKDAPSERALHQLDVYKTPLLPTRMRSSNLPASITATTTPDMFKSRRKSHLVLMQDDKDRMGRKVSGSGKSPVVNQTKPYAGEGGMKKLLARRKQEEEEEDNEFKEKDKDPMDNDSTPRPHQSPPAIARSIPEPPVPTGADWFSTAAATSSAPSGSSLRVGRSTNRNHLARPAKSRFSAKYDEEAEDVEDERAEKRREMAKEAAQLVPLFKEPPGFSFSLEAPPMEASKDDDPNMFPIASLPFSIPKSSATSSKTSSPKPSAQSLAEENKENGPVQQISIEIPPAPVQVPIPEPKVVPPPMISSLAPPPAPSVGGLPNFFANSKLLSEVKLPTPPPVMNFGPTPTSTTATTFSFAPTTSSTISKPVNEPENPFWDGGKKDTEVEPKPAQNLFGGFEKKVDSAPSTSSSTSKPASLFGGATSAFPPIPKSKPEEAPSISSASQLPFSFGKPAETSSPFGAPPVPTVTEPPKVSFGVPAAAKPEVTDTVTPKPLFGTAGSLFGNASQTTSISNPFGAPAVPQSTPSPLPFAFGAPSAQRSTTPAPAPVAAPAPSSQPSFFSAAATTTPAVEAPKSLFGGPSSGGFSFGQPSAEKKEETKTPFSFGATQSAPPSSSITTPKAAPAPFSFGQPSTTPVATPAVAVPSIGFSFSGGGSATSDVSSKPLFPFGQPSATPIDRPITPPKNHDYEFKMEESPTREFQQANNKMPESRPTIGGGAFSFGTSSSAPSVGLFGAGQTASVPAPTPTPFTFGSTTSNPFAAKENKPEEPKTFGGFGQTAPSAPSISTSFSFGQTKPAEDASRPSSGGGFTFGATPTSATATPGAAFSFGAPAASNPFGQPTAPGSAPSSPSTFNQPSPFAFGAPAPAANGGFAFGSQPASPAAGGNLSLPPSGFGTGGGGGFGQPQQPSSPFSAPIALAPSTSGGGGGSLFTIGSAPSLAPGTQRAIKKLPNRRGGAKR